MRSPGTVVFDLDGVLYLDKQGIPGAADALRALEDAGWALRFATNNSTKAADSVARHIKERTGFEVSPSDAVSSAMSAASYAAKRHRSVAVVGSDQLRETLALTGLDVDGADPTAVVVGLDLALTYQTIDRASKLIRGGAEFIATNMDSTYPTPTGLAPGAGTVVAAVREASGAEPVDCGKPSREFAKLIMATISTKDVWMVGDRPETDIALAKSSGWTSVLTLTGVIRDPDLVPARFRADHVIRSVALLPGLILGSEAVTDAPTTTDVVG